MGPGIGRRLSPDLHCGKLVLGRRRLEDSHFCPGEMEALTVTWM